MYSILVIDDEKMVLRMIELVLLKFGYRVETASDGKEGLLKFEQSCFDLVITDILMPDTDGNNVAHCIRHSGKGDTPIVGISGTPWVANEADFDAILIKPFSLNKLVNKVKELINAFKINKKNTCSGIK